MTDNKYSTNTVAQCERLFERLQSAPISTLQARQELDIMHPAARIQELRERGCNIITQWTIDSTSRAKHRVACYVLLAEGV